MIFVNIWQNQDERREKYFLIRSLGLPRYWAYRCRDWPISKIERRFNLCVVNREGSHLPKEWHAQLLLPGFTDFVRDAKNHIVRIA